MDALKYTYYPSIRVGPRDPRVAHVTLVLLVYEILSQHNEFSKLETKEILKFHSSLKVKIYYHPNLLKLPVIKRFLIRKSS